MNCLIAALLLPLRFTAPADSLGPDMAGLVRASPAPVRAYVFYRRDEHRSLVTIRGYADSTGRAILMPHAPGTQETVWLEVPAVGDAVTVYVASLDDSGNLSAPSNGCSLGYGPAQAPLAARRGMSTALDVPIVKLARERCGQAALAMVLRYYGADPDALREVDSADHPALRDSSITDLAGAARRAGYEAAVATLSPDSLIDLLADGVPPILLYRSDSTSATVPRFGVVTGWDATRAVFTLHDGGERPRVMRLGDLVEEWETAGSLALIVRQAAR
jgi:hypothetical protein